jgi:glucosamine--fructose-6-phosphate aminotransferase (isomerizing)
MKPNNPTMMFNEAAQSPEVVQRQLDRNTEIVKKIGRKLRQIKPQFVLTCARGSSDHAASYAKYLIETRTGLFTASSGPSVHSVYKTRMKFSGCVCLVISQSGASPDLLSVASAAREGGAYVIALVNVANSPLANLADEVIELHAGEETSVAATKSFIASISAVIQLLTAWRDEPELHNALLKAPDALQLAWEADWSAAIEPISKSANLFVLGRGLGLGIAYEAALKFKEVCGLHAEGLSSAEVLHGPVTIARANFPVLVLAQNDQAFPGIQNLVGQLAERDISLITAGVSHDKAINLPTHSNHPAIEPMLRILSFYRMANRLSLQLGLNPDCPPYLQKVTSTM